MRRQDNKTFSPLSHEIGLLIELPSHNGVRCILHLDRDSTDPRGALTWLRFTRDTSGTVFSAAWPKVNEKTDFNELQSQRMEKILCRKLYCIATSAASVLF
jgi:hypothetical protein